MPGVAVEYNAINEGHLSKLKRRYPDAQLGRFKETFVGYQLDGFKLIEGSKGDSELFRLGEELREETDLAAKRPERVEAIRAARERWSESFPHFDAASAEPAEELDPELQAALAELGYLEAEGAADAAQEDEPAPDTEP